MFYFLVVLGTFLEGEISLSVAVYFLMQRGGNPVLLFFFAGLGAFFGDLFFYLWGCEKGAVLKKRFPAFGGSIFKMIKSLSTWPFLLTVILRFQMMMRSIAFFSLGAVRQNKKQQVIYLFCAAWIWSGIVVYILWLFVPFFISLWKSIW
jgi:membrane protein DedA with SNARE-associated domain